MNTNKSFIGAYARNRRGATKNKITPASTTGLPDPHITPAADPPQAPSDAAVSQVEVASIETIESVESMIRRSLSVSDVVADPAPETAQVWIDQPQGQVLRVDPPVAREPETRSYDQPIIEPIAAPKQTAPEAPVPTIDSEPELDPEPELEFERQTQHETASAPEAISHAWAGAAWEVDAFEIPHSVADLFFDEEFFRSIAEHMGQSIQEGLRSVLVTSIGAGEGRSTVAIGTSIAAAASGNRVALVDVDLDSPSLADDLRLDIETDWVDAFRRNLPLENAAIFSLEDGVTLLPLSDERKLPVTPTEFDALIERLTGQFDLVMFDGGKASSWATERIASSVDSSLIVRDARSTSKSDIAIAADELRGKGVRGIGVIDNFCG